MLPSQLRAQLKHQFAVKPLCATQRVLMPPAGCCLMEAPVVPCSGIMRRAWVCLWGTLRQQCSATGEQQRQWCWSRLISLFEPSIKLANSKTRAWLGELVGTCACKQVNK